MKHKTCILRFEISVAEGFKAGFSDFEVLAYSLVCKMWKVYTRPTSASEFFRLELHFCVLFVVPKTQFKSQVEFQI
jgi:hypothetical protein